MTIEQARAKRWTPEARARQSAKIAEWQPWTKSTGARTVQGQANSAKNGRFKRVVYKPATDTELALTAWFKKKYP
jgi:hypothetical protein